MLFKLVKAGYGTATQILDTPIDIVMGMLHYEGFISEYESVFMELNKKDK